MQRHISPKPYQGSKTMLRNNSVDLRGIFDESEQNQNLSIAASDLNKDREPTLPNILSGDDSVQAQSDHKETPAQSFNPKVPARQSIG